MRTLYLLVVCFILGPTLEARQDSLSIAELMDLQEYQTALAQLVSQDSSMEQQVLLGTCQYRLGIYNDAKSTLEGIVSFDTLHLQSNVMLASIYDQEFNMPKAIKHYRALVQINPENPTYVKNLARAHAKAGLTRLANDLYWEARLLNDRDITILVSLADLAMRDKRWHLADSLAEIGLSIDDDNLQILLTKARTQYAIKDYAQAVHHLEKTRGRLDLLPFHQKMLGYAYLQLDSLDRCIHVLENLLYREESEHTHFYLALAYQKKHDRERSIHHYEKAIDQGISGSLGKYYAGLAKMYREENRLKDAIVAYTEAYEFTGHAVYIFQKAQLSEAYYKDKNLALRQYREAVSTGTLTADQLAFANDRIRLLKEYLHQSNRD